jgi:hypothetical protein
MKVSNHLRNLNCHVERGEKFKVTLRTGRKQVVQPILTEHSSTSVPLFNGKKPKT